MSAFLSSRFEALEPYVPGEQPRDRSYIKLNTNESPYPPSPGAIQSAAQEAQSLRLYPDPEHTELRALLAKKYGLSPAQVSCYNGSDEALMLCFMAYCDKHRPAVFADITYGFYKVFAQVNGVPWRIVPLKDDFAMDVPALMEAEGTLFIANPNAPTGLALSASTIRQIALARPDRIVVVDEAYVDFGGESSVSLLKECPNLIVVQTFSKSRSMAGARLGYALCSEALTGDLNTLRYSINPYNVNRVTLAAGAQMLRDDEYYRACVKKVISAREETARALSEMGFFLTASRANFLFARHDKLCGEELYKELRQRGILVRHFDQPRIGDFVRISVGTPEDMHLLTGAIREILEERQ